MQELKASSISNPIKSFKRTSDYEGMMVGDGDSGDPHSDGFRVDLAASHR